MFFKKRTKSESITDFMSPIEFEKHIKAERKRQQELLYGKYKKALDNIKDYVIHCDFQEALDLIEYLGKENYIFTAMLYHDIHSCSNDKFIEVKKKEEK